MLSWVAKSVVEIVTHADEGPYSLFPDAFPPHDSAKPAKSISPQRANIVLYPQPTLYYCIPSPPYTIVSQAQPNNEDL